MKFNRFMPTAEMVLWVYFFCHVELLDTSRLLFKPFVLYSYPFRNYIVAPRFNPKMYIVDARVRPSVRLSRFHAG